MSTSKKILTGLLVLIMVLCLGAILIESRAHVIRQLVDNYIYDNRNHYLPCGKLPAEAEVRTIIQQHQDLIRAVQAVNPGLAGVDVDASACPGKADLLIWYASHADRLAIENMIGSDTFFGIPYRMQNR
jgi:hypothetical protein